MFIFGEGLAETVVEGGGEGGAAALCGIVGYLRGAGREFGYEGL